MKLVKFRSEKLIGVGVLGEGVIEPLKFNDTPYRNLKDVLESDNPATTAEKLKDIGQSIPMEKASLLAPIDLQEVWAAGVTYKRSRTARMEESAAAASCYDRVYVSPRPELFMKATPHRVAGPASRYGSVRIQVGTSPNPN